MLELLSLDNNELSDVSVLMGLTSLTELRLSNNPAMSCQSLAALISVLGSPPVDIDGDVQTQDSVEPDLNCV
jgi:Leucine-rich repeat (LRR) protein